MRSIRPDNAALEASVFAEQMKLLAARRLDLIVNLVLSALAAPLLWHLYPAWLSASWLVSFWIVILARAMIRRRLSCDGRSVEATRRYARIATVACAVTASLWGLTGSVILLTPDPYYHVLVEVLLGGLMAGGIATNAGYLPALYAFLFPTMLPMIVLSLATRDRSDLALGGSLAILGAVLTIAGRTINRTIVESLRLRIEQEFLVVELRTSEASMAEAQRSAHVGALEFDVATQLFGCTDETFRILGVDRRTFVPSFENVMARVHPDDRAETARRLTAFGQTGIGRDFDYRIVMDGGEVKWVRAIGRRIERPRGKPERLFLAVQDVTAQEISARELAYRDDLLLAVTAGTAILLRTEAIDQGMPEALRILGESMRLDYISIVEEAPQLASALGFRYSWSAREIPTHTDAGYFVAPPASPAVMAATRARLAAGEIVIAQLAADDDPLHAMLERIHAKSMLLVAVIVDGRLWGNLAASTSVDARDWTENEINTLKSFSSIVGALIVRNESRLALETSERRFRTLTTAAQDAIITMDSAGHINSWNLAAERILGYRAAEAIGKSIHEIMVPALYKEKAGRGLSKFLSTGEGEALGRTTEMTAIRKNGTEVAVEVSLAGARIGHGWQAIGILRDISARKKSDGELQFANMLLKTEMDASPDGILVVGAHKTIVTVNRRFLDIWGISAAEIAPSDDSIVLAAVARAVKEPQKFTARVEYLYAHPDENGDEEIELIDGRCLDRRTASLKGPAGEYLGRVWYFRDITTRKRAEALAVRMARYDGLTGLANRGVFVEAIEHAIADAKRGKGGFAVLYLDLDHFKDVNDTLGHPIGDALLRAVAGRLRTEMRAGDSVARFGGDEFAVLVSDVARPADVAAVAGNLVQALAEPFVVAGNEIRSGASIGVDVFGPESGDAETLLSHADVALYRAKADGRGSCRFFTDAMDKALRSRVTLAAELRAGLASGQFFLMYQPQVAAESGRIEGFEALARWHHPERGILGPSAFIPTAEITGSIVGIGQWVLLSACVQAKAWLDAGFASLKVAVNVSGLQFKMPLELEANIMAALAQTGLPARLLEVELTETVLMDSSTEHTAVLGRLRKAGVRLAIDDFGTGYSSLAYLGTFPVDRIKIAQAFVRNITIAPGQAAIVRATIGLAKDLGIEIIAEGVETRAQFEALKNWGCTEIQGFYFAKPLSAEDVTLALRKGGVITPQETALA
jgi:diguanylate cyclase (GGDEF)-like protein/PAS domain S-box-containing protein